MMARLLKTVSTILALSAVAAVGALFGWLVGASDSPVVHAVLPLIFGLIGGFSLRHLGTPAQLGKFTASEKSEPSDGVISHHMPEGRAIITSLAIILFIVAAYAGIDQGLHLRHPKYPSVSSFTDKISNISWEEKKELHRLRMGLMRMNTSPEDVTQIFEHSVIPMFLDSNYTQGGELFEYRYSILRSAIDDFLLASETKAGRGRGPASSLDEPEVEPEN